MTRIRAAADVSFADAAIFACALQPPSHRIPVRGRAAGPAKSAALSREGEARVRAVRRPWSVAGTELGASPRMAAADGASAMRLEMAPVPPGATR